MCQGTLITYEIRDSRHIEWHARSKIRRGKFSGFEKAIEAIAVRLNRLGFGNLVYGWRCIIQGSNMSNFVLPDELNCSNASAQLLLP
jgi:hypothetical protein